MRLIDILEAESLMAKRAALMRDYKAAMSGLQKVAQDKTAGPLGEAAEKAMSFLARPFQKSPMEQLIAAAKGRELGTLKSLVDLIPHDPAQIKIELGKIPDEIKKITERTISHPGGTVESVVEKTMKPGVKNPLMQHVEDVQRIRKGLESGDSKVPYRAAMGLLVGQAAVGSGLMAIEKNRLDKAHDDNLALIAGDTQIPASLRNRAKDMYGILVRYAPSIARDSVFARDFTKNLIRHDTVDHKIIQDLTSMEKTYREAKGRKAEFLSAVGDMTLKATGWF